MAEIYDLENGDEITVGLQGSDVCDEAIRAARNIAADRNETVQLVDDDGTWDVYPDGKIRKSKVERLTLREPGGRRLNEEEL